MNNSGLRVPLNENSVRFKYVLVIGRNAEKDNSEKRRAMFAEKSDNDIRVMTYDSLVSQCESVPYNGEKIILSTWKEQGFKIKKLPKQEISTSLFAYLRPEYLQISERDIEILKRVMRRMIDNGNTVIVIEHNLDFIMDADYIIDMGPDAGKNGGKIVYEGTLKDILKENTYTAQALRNYLEL